jgi:uncharacterized protein (DUF433 family)
MKLKIEKTMRWSGARHHHPSPRRQSPDKLWWPTAKRNYFEMYDHGSTCETAVFGYSDELLAVFERAAKECPSISVNPKILEGQPCIAGTRIPVHSVLRAIEHYGSVDAAVGCYPHLTIPQVKDALYFAQIVLEPVDGINETETAS